MYTGREEAKAVSLNSYDDSMVLFLQHHTNQNNPPPFLSLWYTQGDEADLHCLDNAVIRLSDASMALTKLQSGVTADKKIRQLRLGLKKDCGKGLALSKLCRLSPALDELLKSQQSCFVVSDRRSCVSGAIQSLLSCASLPLTVRAQCEEILCCYTLLCVADAISEGQPALSADNPHVQRALEYMHTHYKKPIQAKHIAQAAGIHPGHLHRLFYEQTGKRLSEHLCGLRMEQAKQMLMATDLSVTQIASAIGLSSQPYFNRVFKSFCGISPQQFRSAFNITCDYSKACHLYYAASLPDEEDGL